MARTPLWSINPAPSSAARVAHLAVAGMGSEEVAQAVEAALRQVPGVWLVAVQGDEAMVAVAYDPSEIRPGVLLAVVEAAGIGIARNLRAGLMHTRPLRGGGLWV